MLLQMAEFHSFLWPVFHLCVCVYTYIHTCMYSVPGLESIPGWDTWVQATVWEHSLEKGKATHSSILACRIPWAI